VTDAASLRAKAATCRQLAENADERTATTLHMLADDYEAEARELDTEPKPQMPN
jgi:hypothetical protein